MKKIDAMVLLKFQQCSDFAQLRFGVTCFGIVKYIGAVIFFSNIMHVVNEYEWKHTADPLFDGFLLLVPLLLLYVNNMAASKQTSGTKNYFELLLVSARPILGSAFLVLILTSIVFIVLQHTSVYAYISGGTFIMFFASGIAALYFLCCTPRPPSKNTAKKLTDISLSRIKELLTPASRLHPV